MNAGQLKNSILQMAVQGKLVPQDLNDEPASVLLERIRTEKQRLIKEGKIKKDKNESVIYRSPRDGGETADNLPYTFFERTADGAVRNITDQLPFDVPETWEWVCIGDVCETVLGKMLDKARNMGEYKPYLRNANVQWGKFELSDLLEMKFGDDETDRYGIKRGDLIMCEGGEPGRCAIWQDDMVDMRIQKALHRIRPKCGILSEYVFYVFWLLADSGRLSEFFTGTTIKHLPEQALIKIRFPLPPLAEQQRIVERIEELLPHIADYDVAERRLTALNTTFPDALKKSILQVAVQGKLVPQDPADEPASILLERIREEKEKLIKASKIKRDKHESVIFRRDNSHYTIRDGVEVCIDDEIPFEIPDSWAWARLGSICDLYTGNSINETEKRLKYTNIADGRNYIATKDVRFDNSVDYENGVKIPFDNNSFRIAPSKSTLMCIEGGSAGRKIAIVDREVCFGNKLCCFNTILLDSTYVYLFLQSPVFTANFTSSITGIIGGVSVNSIKNLLLPIPPLLDQERIVTRVEELTQKMNTM